MQEHERKIRPALAIIVVICFFMPFVQLTCGGQKIATLTGFDLATGTTVVPPDMMSGFPGGQSYAQGQSVPTETWYESTEPEPEPMPQPEMGEGKIDAVWSATGALVFALVALLASFMSDRRGYVISSASAGICAVLLLILKANGLGEMPPEAVGILGVEWTMQYWAALVCSGLLAVFTFRLLGTIESAPAEKPRLVIQSYQEKQPTSQA